jgi:hypothetical protein
MTPGARLKGDPTRLVIELVSGATVEDAARSAGMSEATAYRRLKHPDFRREFDEARSSVVTRATSKLTTASTEAVDTLRGLLSSDHDFAKLAAARAILELGIKLREHEDLAVRIAALERAAQDARAWDDGAS